MYPFDRWTWRDPAASAGGHDQTRPDAGPSGEPAEGTARARPTAACCAHRLRPLPTARTIASRWVDTGRTATETGDNTTYDAHMRIERVTDAAAVLAGADLYDAPPTPEATRRFLDDPWHHLLYAYDSAGRPVGMISGVETTHPDKGTEMFLYELSVAEPARRQGVATALVRALADLARSRGCYGMWVGTEPDNIAALATYRRAGGLDEAPFVALTWDFGDAPR